MKMISRIAAAMALLVVGVGTTTLHADTFDRAATQVVAFAAETGQTVLVVNDYVRHDVRVYAVDSDNRTHLLGRVGPSRIAELQLPAGLVRETDTVKLKVYPILPSLRLGTSAFEPVGVTTRDISVQSDQVIYLYLKPDLTTSMVSVVSS